MPDKIEAGNEGAIDGKRVVLGLQNDFTFHYRIPLLQQSRAPSDPSLRVAMNAALEFQVGNAPIPVLDQNYRDGWAWSGSWQFLILAGGAPRERRAGVTNEKAAARAAAFFLRARFPVEL